MLIKRTDEQLHLISHSATWDPAFSRVHAHAAGRARLLAAVDEGQGARGSRIAAWRDGLRQ
jgi:hypothetical protein